MTRPICACCGKPYGSRDTITETVRWRCDQEPPRYTGKMQVVREVSRKLASWTNGMERIDYRRLWDGESYVDRYNPFCTLRCTLRFARAAYKGGYRVPDATAEHEKVAS